MENNIIKTEKQLYYEIYYEKNLTNLKEKINCPICNCQYKKYNKTHHFKTEKHKNMEMKQQLRLELEVLKQKLEFIKNI